MQFERVGYFVADWKDHRPGRPVFNRSVGLRDTWAKIEKAVRLAGCPPRGSAGAAPERLSADWGSAGAISGPPQLKSLKKETAVRRLGECGGHFWAPAAEEPEERNGRPPTAPRLVEEHPRVDVEHLAGDAVRSAERDHLIRHVLHPGRAA